MWDQLWEKAERSEREGDKKTHACDLFYPFSDGL